MNVHHVKIPNRTIRSPGCTGSTGEWREALLILILNIRRSKYQVYGYEGIQLSSAQRIAYRTAVLFTTCLTHIIRTRYLHTLWFGRSSWGNTYSIRTDTCILFGSVDRISWGTYRIYIDYTRTANIQDSTPPMLSDEFQSRGSPQRRESKRQATRLWKDLCKIFLRATLFTVWAITPPLFRRKSTLKVIPRGCATYSTLRVIVRETGTTSLTAGWIVSILVMIQNTAAVIRTRCLVFYNTVRSPAWAAPSSATDHRSGRHGCCCCCCCCCVNLVSPQAMPKKMEKKLKKG